jgi:hemoglobin
MTNAHQTSQLATRPGGVSCQVDDLIIRAVVDDFYQAARQDPLLGPVFEQHVGDWPAHLETMYGFWATLLHGGRRYAGNPFEKHRAVPELSGDHFARWLNLFAETLSRYCNPRDAATWEAMVRRMGFSMSYRLGLGERSDLLP